MGGQRFGMKRLLARSSTRERLRPSVFVAVAVVATAAGVALYLPDPFHFLELKTVDARFAIRGNQPPPAKFVVVAVDEATFTELGFHWPFAYKVHARVLDRINGDRPQAVALDIQFSEHSASGLADDEKLAQAISNSNGKVVIATTVVGAGGHTTLFGSQVTPADLSARAGDGQFPNDVDGAIRRMPYAIDGLKSLGVATAEVASRHRIPAPPGGDQWIDYYGPPGTIRTVSYARVYQGRVPKAFFRDKIVVIGASAPTLQDLHETAVSSGKLMSGPEIQANAIGTALRGFRLRHVGSGIDLLMIAVMGLLAPLASIRLSLIGVVAVILTAAAALTFGTQLAFNSGRIVTFVYPLIALILSAMGALGGHYVLRAFEAVRVRDLFSRFVPADVVDHVIAGELRLGGVRREGTVMFTDLRGFTSFAESLEPERVIDVINQYLGGMTEAILDHGGTLVSYMGDGIMALWGAPVAQPDHADRALAAAREMRSERLPTFNAWMAEQGFGHAFRMGIGLNSGSVMSGNVGSERRLEYTAIGDTTNTASRLEGMTKGTLHQIFVADSTREALREPQSDLVYVDELEIRGRAAKLKIWTLAEDKEA